MYVCVYMYVYMHVCMHARMQVCAIAAKSFVTIRYVDKSEKESSHCVWSTRVLEPGWHSVPCVG